MNDVQYFKLKFNLIMENSSSIERVLQLADLMIEIESSKGWQERDDEMMALYRQVAEARSF